MSDQNNKYPIKGTIYDIKRDEVSGKKDPTAKYAKYLITLEVSSSEERNVKDGTKYMTKTEFPQFESFAPKYDIDSFHIGDFVEIRFFLQGQKFTYSKGEKAGQEGIMNKNVITFMKFADIEGTSPRPNIGKVTITSSTDVKELTRDKVFVQPDPEAEEELSDLPFILTALIGIGSMFII